MGRQKHSEKLFLGLYSRKFFGFLLNNALVYMFRRIQNESLKKECILVRIRGAFLAEKGAPKLNFYREGGQLPPSAPPKSATEVTDENPISFLQLKTANYTIFSCFFPAKFSLIICSSLCFHHSFFPIIHILLITDSVILYSCVGQ